MTVSGRRARFTSKIFTVFLAACFAFTQILFAHRPVLTVWNERHLGGALAPENSPPLLSLSPKNVDALPMTSCVMKEIHVFPSKPTVILLQDIHLNAEAQRNMLRQLREWGPRIGMVAVEGAFGPFDFSAFYRGGDARVRSKLTSALLNSKHIGAVSSLGLTDERISQRMVGVDDAFSYAENLQAYLSTVSQKPKAERELSQRERALNARKRTVFSAPLLVLDRKVNSYRAHEIGLGELIPLLSPQTREMRQFTEAAALEKKIDFVQADADRRRVLESVVPRLGPREAASLAQSGIDYKNGTMSRAAYYRLIETILARRGVTLERFPQFSDYIRYALLSDAIDGDALLTDVQNSIPASLSRLAETPLQKELVVTSESLHLERGLIDFSLTPAEWEEYKKLTADGLKSFERFYKLADVRSEKMVKNLDNAVHGNNQLVVLVVGGFHTPAIKRLLERKGWGYGVVSPTITSVDGADGESYLSYFSRAKTPLEKLFSGERLTLAPAAQFLGTEDSYTVSVNREGRLMEQLFALARRNTDGVYEWGDPGALLYAIRQGDAIPAGYHPVVGAVIASGDDSYQMLEKTQRWERIPLGLMGFWTHFLTSKKRLSDRMIGLLSFSEGLAIVCYKLLILQWLSSQFLLLPLQGASALAVTYTAIAWAAMVSLCLFPALWAFHLVFGVLQPDGKPYWNRWMAYVSAFVASSSFLGTPFLAVFFLLPPTWMSFGLLFIGIIIDSGAQVVLNALLMRRHAGKIDLPTEQLEPLAHTAQTVLDFLAHRSVVPFDKKARTLREKDVYKPTDGIVWKNELNRHNLGETDPDAFIVLGSHYPLVAIRAAEIYFRLGDKAPGLIVFSGGKGDRNPKHFPPEANTFKDLFLFRLHELRLKALEANKRLSLMGKDFSGLRRVLMRAGVAMHDAVFFWRTEATMNKLILIENESTNTGANIKNTERLLFQQLIKPALDTIQRQDPFLSTEQLHSVEDDLSKILPKNPIIITVHVFQLRAILSFLKQTTWKLKSIISYAAYRVNLWVSLTSGLMSVDEFLEIALEANVQMQRLMNDYVNPVIVDGQVRPPYIVPIIIPDDVKRASADLSAALERLPAVYAKDLLAKVPVPKTKKRRVIMGITGLLLVLNGIVLYFALNKLGLGDEFIGTMYICTIALFAGLAPTTLVALVFSRLPASLDTPIQSSSIQEVWLRVVVIGLVTSRLGSYLLKLTPNWYFGVAFFIANCLMLLLLYGWSTEYEAHALDTEQMEAAPGPPASSALAIFPLLAIRLDGIGVDAGRVGALAVGLLACVILNIAGDRVRRKRWERSQRLVNALAGIDPFESLGLKYFGDEHARHVRPVLRTDSVDGKLKFRLHPGTRHAVETQA